MLFKFRGTPRQLVDKTKQFVPKWSSASPLPITLSSGPSNDENALSIFLQTTQGDSLGVEARSDPAGTTLVFVDARRFTAVEEAIKPILQAKGKWLPNHWQDDFWSKWAEEMQQQGFVDSPWTVLWEKATTSGGAVCEYLLASDLEQLSAMTTRCISSLDSRISARVEYQVVSTTPGVVIFKLSDRHGGNVGEIRLYKISEGQTQLVIHCPTQPTDEETLEYILKNDRPPDMSKEMISLLKEYLQQHRTERRDQNQPLRLDGPSLLSLAPERLNLDKLARLSASIDDSRTDLLRWRDSVQGMAILGYFGNLRREAMWKQAISRSPDRGVRDESKKMRAPSTGVAPTATQSKGQGKTEERYSQRGRNSKYSRERMYRAVKKWEKLRKNRGKGLFSSDNLDSIDNGEMDGDKALSEFLRDEFGQNEASEPRVPTRTFQQWGKNFRDGTWEVPMKKKRR